MRFSEIKSHLSKFKVGIAGAGGLGSNCATALARSGVGTLVIADYDKIEECNLNRQYYFTDQIGKLKTDALKENVFRINPGINVVIQQKRLDRLNIPEVFSGCDVIVEAFDSADMKEMLIETVQTRMPGITVVAASGLAGFGNNDTVRCRKIDDTLYICGDESSEAEDDLPPMAPRVGIVANMQANTVIDILMKKK
ncbi:MAG: sulfur carrier protein ThiS adenylyltransferase ThiF [Bacteroidales bacterium]|nr:sulfur carrier protein ThiS adenylyltransferase ThiF [Bacteroidales bacterium]